MCILQGTYCDTGIPCTFYGEKICSVSILEKSSFWKKNLETPWKKIPILKYEKINKYKIRQIFGQKLARSLLKPIFELTPYKGPWIVVCLLNGPLSQDLASKNSYRGSPTYTKITNTVSTNTFFGLCTCKWGN